MMGVKFLCLVVLFALVSQGHALTEYRLDDESRTYHSNPLLGSSIVIPKSPLDTLESCHVVLPGGRVVEAYPTDNIDLATVSFMTAVQPYTSCGIQFRNSPASLSGTYELMSVVNHRSNSSLTLARQRFHLTIVMMEGWN